MQENPDITDEELAMMVTGARTVPPAGEKYEIAEAERLFRENLPVAAAVICELAVHAEKETTRLNAAKYVVERVLGRVGDPRVSTEDNPYDFLSNLLREPTAAERVDGRPVSRG